MAWRSARALSFFAYGAGRRNCTCSSAGIASAPLPERRVDDRRVQRFAGTEPSRPGPPPSPGTAGPSTVSIAIAVVTAAASTPSTRTTTLTRWPSPRPLALAVACQVHASGAGRRLRSGGSAPACDLGGACPRRFAVGPCSDAGDGVAAAGKDGNGEGDKGS